MTLEEDMNKQQLVRQVHDLEHDLETEHEAREHEHERVEVMASVLHTLGVTKSAVPQSQDPVYIAGHVPALEVYRTPDPRVRVEGQNTPLANSLEVSEGSDDRIPNQERRMSIVYSQEFRPTHVELKVPYFFLPDDPREIIVTRQGEEVYR